MSFTNLNWGYLLFCFILISWGCLTSSILLFLQWANLIDHCKKNVKTMEAPQNRRLYGMIKCLPLWPTYVGEKGRTLGKTYGARCYWEHLWGAHWEFDVNPLGTWREHVGTKGKMKKILPPTKRNFKAIKSRHFEWMLSLPIGYMKFLFPKLFITIFGLG